jgi:acetylornithine deacetylase/succinyl-diaminopimelate desuccinylase-like protein
MLERTLSDIDDHREANLEGLKELLRIPSVSTQPQHKADVLRCAQWLAARLAAAGMEAKVVPTRGHPVVLGRTPAEDSAGRPAARRPTVLVYGHYDVQPPEPLELWQTPPFEPTVRDGALHARGAADDKGQTWAHIAAAEAWQRQGGPPVNLIFMLEGEEEIGSEHLGEFMNEHREELKADIALISDTSQFCRGVPTITYGLRGLVYMEVKLTAAGHDLHSGLYGAAVPNPANELCALLASLHDRDGRVNLEGFYDDVLPLADIEREMWSKLPFDEKLFADELELKELCGEGGYNTIERRWARPTLDINGLSSGYEGPGAKTIIPSSATAKVSMRLVPNQDPHKIQRTFEQTLRARCPSYVKIEFHQYGAAEPVLVPREGRAMQLAAEAVQIGFGTPPVLTREGGTIPVVAMIKSVLGIDTILVGFGLPDDRIHSPNEKFDLEALHQGTRTAAALYERMGGLRG